MIGAKGGTGKTSVAVGLGSALARGGASVVLVDADPQGGLSSWWGVEQREGLSELLSGRGVEPVEVAEGLSVVGHGDPEDLLRRSMRPPVDLSPYLDALRAAWLIVDTAPGWSNLTASVLAWASGVLLPVSLVDGFLPLAGLGQARERVEDTGTPFLVVPTKLDRRTKLSEESHADLLEHFRAGQVAEPIRINSRIPAAAWDAADPLRGLRAREDFEALADKVERMQ